MSRNKDIVAVSLNKKTISQIINTTFFILIFLNMFVFGCEATINSSKYIVVVVYSNSPQNFSFIVDGVNVGTDRKKLISYLKMKGTKEIIFKSEYKLDESSIKDFETFFLNADLNILEFWVPISGPPGLINLKGKTN